MIIADETADPMIVATDLVRRKAEDIAAL